MFDGMTEAEIEELFDIEGDVVEIKSWIKEGIKWRVGDVGQSEIVAALGPQDIVVANNFLCHMNASMAERCLRNIARLVTPYGYLFVSGVDLDIRTKVAKELGGTRCKSYSRRSTRGIRTCDATGRSLFGLGAVEQEKTGLETPLRGGFSIGPFRRGPRQSRDRIIGPRAWLGEAAQALNGGLFNTRPFTL